MNPPNRLPIRLALGTLTALLAAAQAPAPALAQSAPEVYHACFVPLTGTVYRIKTPETRPTCSSTSHVEFSWNQEGPQGPPGPPGVFSGALSSPNGQFSLSITDTGIELRGPSGLVRLSAAGIEVAGDASAPVSISSAASVLVHSGNDVRVQVDRDLLVDASRDLVLEADRNLLGSGSIQLTGPTGQLLLNASRAELRSLANLHLTGLLIRLNGACNQLAPTTTAC